MIQRFTVLYDTSEETYTLQIEFPGIGELLVRDNWQTVWKTLSLYDIVARIEDIQKGKLEEIGSAVYGLKIKQEKSN